MSIAYAYFGIIFVNVMWGLSFIASKTALGSGFGPFTLAMTRYVLTCVMMLPLLRLREGELRLPKRGFWLLLLSSLCGISLYFLFEYEGLARTTASNASLIIASVPVFTMLYSALFRRQRYNAACWIGVALSLVGVYFVVRYGGEGGGSLVGNLLLLGAVVCWVAYIELTDHLLAHYGYSSLELTCWQSVLGTLTLLPLSLTESVDFTAIAPVGWWATLFLAVVCSALCYILYADSIRVLKPMRTALFINLNPLAALLGGVVLLNEPLTPAQLGGGAIILISIFGVNYLVSKQDAQHA